MRLKMAVLLSIIFSMLMVSGCANQHAKEDESSWNKDVIVSYRKNIKDDEIDKFVERNHLEFLSQYDYYVYKYRIQTGESIQDFIDRLATDPNVDSIRPADDETDKK